jgi:RES domain-containing protein
MQVWRVCRRQHAAFDGEGARLAGGRWSHSGIAIVYTSATLSLATLELLFQLGQNEVPRDLVAVSAEIPDTLPRTGLDIERVPDRDWRRYPTLTGLRDVGTRWVASMDTAVLGVPSAIVPTERNYLLNPAHPAFREIRIGVAEPFSLRPGTPPSLTHF